MLAKRTYVNALQINAFKLLQQNLCSLFLQSFLIFIFVSFLDVAYDGILPGWQPLKSGEVTLHIYPNFFTLVRKQNSRCIGRWKFEQLFNYGPVDGGFVFRVENVLDGGSTEPDSYLLVTSLEKQINRTFDTVYKTAQHMYGSVGEY